MAATEQHATSVLTEGVSHRPLKRAFPSRVFLCLCLGVSVLKSQTPPRKVFEAISAQFDRGEYTLALEPARQAWLRTDTGPEWHLRFQLLYAQLLLYNRMTPDAEALLKDAPSPEFASQMARYQYLKSYYLFRIKQLPAAERLARSAVKTAEAARDFATEADALVLLANSDFVKDPVKTRKAGLQALALAQANHLPAQEAAALLNFGFSALRQGHYADAIPYFQKAAPAAQKVQAHYVHVLALSDLGECYYSLGYFDRAFRTLNEARPQLLKSDPVDLKFFVNYELGSLHLLRRESTEAVFSFREAMTLTDQERFSNLHIMALVQLAETLLTQGAVDEAAKYNDKAESVFESAKSRAEDLQASIDLNQADIAEKRGALESAASGYQKVIRSQAHAPLSPLQWSAYAKLGSVQERLGRWTAAKLSFDHALLSIEASRSAQKTAEYQINYLYNSIHFYQDYVALLIKQHEEQAALAVADSSRASVLSQGRADSRQLPNIYASLQQVARASKSLILFYWLAEKATYLWSITPTATHLSVLPGEAEIKRDVDVYNNSIQSKRQDTLAQSNQDGKRLYKTLLGTVAETLHSGANVIIVPDGALHNLNFETLLVDGPVPHYWLDDVTITVAPSLNILLTSRAASSQAGKRALLLGDASYDGSGFPALPQSATEIASVRKHFADATVITKGQAQVAAFWGTHPERFATIHTATHVEADRYSPLDSAIILSPSETGSRLYARDVANSKLTANLVTISGCRSAGAGNLSGEGLVGFAWASLYAGAHNAVTSLWEVDDRSTADLMDNFYAGVAAGKPYPMALREAKLNIKKSYRKPYYWAPFQLYSRAISSVKAESNMTSAQSR